MFDQTPIAGAAVDTPVLPPYRPRPLSVVLRELAAREQGDVTVRCIRNALADRSFATFLVFTCVINMLPFPPGSTVVLGVPIVLVALQMVAARDTVWLPEFFLKRSMSHESFGRMTRRVIPLLEKLETWIRPRRWPFSSHRAAERIVGLYALILGDRWPYVLYWAVPSILASIQLFVFGTWLPHRTDDYAPFADSHNARSPAMSDTLSLLTCYHFGGYHHEHHLHPSVPWWRLPSTRRTRA